MLITSPTYRNKWKSFRLCSYENSNIHMFMYYIFMYIFQRHYVRVSTMEKWCVRVYARVCVWLVKAAWKAGDAWILPTTFIILAEQREPLIKIAYALSDGGVKGFVYRRPPPKSFAMSEQDVDDRSAFLTGERHPPIPHLSQSHIEISQFLSGIIRRDGRLVRSRKIMEHMTICQRQVRQHMHRFFSLGLPASYQAPTI